MTATTIGALAQRGMAVGAVVRSGAPDVARATASVVADTLGCLHAGGDHPTVQRLLGSQDTMPGPDGGSPLASPGHPRSPSDALVVDVVAAHVDEFDGVHPRSGTVPGAVVVPVALHVGAHLDASGPDVLAAVAAGYEVTVAAALTLGGSTLYQTSWWPAAVAGRLGVAATVAHLLGLDEARTGQALALAAASSGGLLSEDVFADGHYLLLGDAAVAGVHAARRAASGLRGSTTLLDGPARRAFRAAPSPVPAGPPQILVGLHKEFPAATPLQAVIRGLQAFDDVDAIRAATAIEVAVPAGMLAYVSTDRAVDGPPEAAASLAYVVGAVARGAERDVRYFRAASPGSTFPGRLALVPGTSEEAVVITMTQGDGRRLTRVEPLRQVVVPSVVVARKLAHLFGPESPWPGLPERIVAGLSPRDLIAWVRAGLTEPPASAGSRRG